MTDMISKELLSEVLGKECRNIDDNVVHNNLYFWINKDNSYEVNDFINIYELAHKCKEWALQQGFQLWSGYQIKDNSYAVTIYKNDDYADCDESLANTEPEAIFKACQWILDNKEQK